MHLYTPNEMQCMINTDNIIFTVPLIYDQYEELELNRIRKSRAKEVILTCRQTLLCHLSRHRGRKLWEGCSEIISMLSVAARTSAFH